MIKTLSERAKTAKSRFEIARPYLPFVFFSVGFLWDTLTLNRIDNTFDNALLITYLVLLGCGIVISTLLDRDRLSWNWLYRFRMWVQLGIQFLLGGLFSAFVVFYFKSASLASSLLFVGILIALFVGNEFWNRSRVNLYIQLPLYFLVSFSFFIFFVPVVIKRVDYISFWIGALLSLFLLAVIISVIYVLDGFKHRREMIVSGMLTISMFLGIHYLYSNNLIPPVPLSLKFSGMYYNLVQDEDRYALSIQKPYWFHFWKDGERTLRIIDGDNAFCFTSIFAPTDLKDEIQHVWQWNDPTTNGWEVRQISKYPITGGREDGYRGYSEFDKLTPGKWRVAIKSRDGLLLGRVNFKVVSVGRTRPLTTIYQ
ncbi:MAG: DUF2914 domain-containing protein [bacterium]|nr:DUF2914 domain-containing protein [bacterium]